MPDATSEESPVRYRHRSLHPLHATLLAFVLPLFLGGWIADIAYARSYETQWLNFAQWLNAGGLLFGGFAVIAALVTVFTFRPAYGAGPSVYLIMLVSSWVIGLANAFIHAGDGWAVMPMALVFSGSSAVAAFFATWLGYSGFAIEEEL